MIFIPLPLVIALMLSLLLIRLLRRGEWQDRAKRPFLILIGLYTLQSTLIALRWGYSIPRLVPAVAITAALLAPMAWLSFQGLATGRTVSAGRAVPHLLPAAAVALMFLVWRAPVGPTMILIFLGYGAALVWMARRGPDALLAARFDGAFYSHRSMLLTGAAMIASALSDIVISLDYARSGGQNGGLIVALGNLLVLLGLGIAAAGAGAGAAQAQEAAGTEGAPPEPEPPAPPTSEEDAAVFAALETAMQERALYRDAELNLSRIARKMNLPARRVSHAVNRVAGLSVSHYVNDYRIRDACRQLEESEAPITRIMFDSGFLSKSNFNREFARLTGMTPSAFRRRHRPQTKEATKDPAFLSR